MSGQGETPRRWRLLDAILLIAGTAVAMLPAVELWTEVGPVVQQLEVRRVFQPSYVRDLFSEQMRSGRTRSLRDQLSRVVAPTLGLPNWRWGYLDWETRERAPKSALDAWVFNHAPPGALGFAIAQDLFCIVFPFLIVWSFCCFAFRLARPRPAWSVLFRQPGWWACSGSMLGALAGTAAEYCTHSPVPSIIVPVTVMVAWIVLAVSRKWHAEPSWIDRAGRRLGVLWLATIPIYLTGFVWNR